MEDAMLKEWNPGISSMRFALRGFFVTNSQPRLEPAFAGQR